MGYTKDYNDNTEKGVELKKFLALPFLPKRMIYLEFKKLKERLIKRGVLINFLEYFEKTYINSNIFKPENWSVHNMVIRTNNGIESWNSRFQRRVAKKPGFKKVLLEFGREAKLVKINLDLLTEEIAILEQKKQYQELQGNIFHLWQKFDDSEITSGDLLNEIISLNMK